MDTEQHLCIVVSETHDLLRRCIKDMLTLEFHNSLVITTDNNESLLHLVSIYHPNVILMGFTSFLMTSCIKSITPEARIVILADNDYDIYRNDALAAGAGAYILKHNLCKELIDKIKELVCSMPIAHLDTTTLMNQTKKRQKTFN